MAKTEEARAQAIYEAARNWYMKFQAGLKPDRDLMAFYRAMSGSTAIHIVVTRSGSSRRVYHCNICGGTVDTESASWKMTVHARRNVEAHSNYHREDQEYLFADDFEFRRMAETLTWDRRDRIMEWREALAWAVDRIGATWPPEPCKVVGGGIYGHPKDARIPMFVAFLEDGCTFPIALLDARYTEYFSPSEIPVYPIDHPEIARFSEDVQAGKTMTEIDLLRLFVNTMALEEIDEGSTPSGLKEWRPGVPEGRIHFSPWKSRALEEG